MERNTPEKTRAIKATCDHLCRLLLHKEAYYQLWLPPNELAPPTRLSQVAVSRAFYKRECTLSGIDYEPNHPAVRDLKDKISRVVSGEILTRDTLDLFINGFNIDADDVADLETLFGGGQLGQLDSDAAKGNAWEHETEQLHETHYIGGNRQPLKHRTLQRIRSIVECLEVYTFRYVLDDPIELEVISGGVAGAPYQFDNRLHAIDIKLNEPLAYGKSASLEYISWFKSPQDHPCFFNRAVRRAVENLEIRVDFLGDLPKEIYWAQWDGYGRNAKTILSEPWRLIGNSVHRGLTHVERAVFGFYWVW